MTDVDDVLRERVQAALCGVIDPEVGIDIVALGLVYGVDVQDGAVHVRLTMTTPACPLGEHLQRDAESRVAAVEGVREVRVELVWSPPWTPDLMSQDAKKAMVWPG